MNQIYTYYHFIVPHFLWVELEPYSCVVIAVVVTDGSRWTICIERQWKRRVHKKCSSEISKTKKNSTTIYNNYKLSLIRGKVTTSLIFLSNTFMKIKVGLFYKYFIFISKYSHIVSFILKNSKYVSALKYEKT